MVHYEVSSGSVIQDDVTIAVVTKAAPPCIREWLRGLPIDLGGSYSRLCAVLHRSLASGRGFTATGMARPAASFLDQPVPMDIGYVHSLAKVKAELAKRR